jgi:hypothetical protein
MGSGLKTESFVQVSAALVRLLIQYPATQEIMPMIDISDRQASNYMNVISSPLAFIS